MPCRGLRKGWSMAEVLVATGLIWVIYNLALYPLVVCWLARKHPAPAQGAVAQRPDRVAFLIAAYNEEAVIAEKLENALALRCDGKPLRVYVVSDGSDDRTADIVASFADRGVVGLHRAERRGKIAALNRAMRSIEEPLVVFSDANNFFEPEAVQILVDRLCADRGVGGVTGRKDVYENLDREASLGDGLYWRYESRIKECEGAYFSINTADGEILAIWTALYRPVPEYIINDDTAITLEILKQGYRVIYEPRARCREEASIRLEDDLKVKIRMASGGFQSLRQYGAAILGVDGRFAWMFLSHKVLRWLMPIALLLVAAGTVMGLPQTWAWLLLGAQIGFYGVGAYGWMQRGRHPGRLVYVVMYFCLMNLAMLLGLKRYLDASQQVTWSKAER